MAINDMTVIFNIQYNIEISSVNCDIELNFESDWFFSVYVFSYDLHIWENKN